MSSAEVHREKYMLNLWGTVQSLSASKKPGRVRCVVKLEEALVPEEITIELPVYHMQFFTPGQRFQVTFEKE